MISSETITEKTSHSKIVSVELLLEQIKEENFLSETVTEISNSLLKQIQRVKWKRNDEKIFHPQFIGVSTHDGPSGYPTHFEFVFYGFQVKDLPKKKEILDLVGSDKMIQLNSKLEYLYLLDVLTYHFESGKYRGKYFVKPNFIEGEPKTFPISIELLSKERFYKSEIIIQLAK